MRKDIIIIILSIGLFIISLLLFNTCSGGEQNPIEKIDTVYRVKYDTITVNRIINNNIYHYDTIIINDTVYIKDIPQTYKDSNENYSISTFNTRTDLFLQQVRNSLYPGRKLGWRQFRTKRFGQSQG